MAVRTLTRPSLCRSTNRFPTTSELSAARCKGKPRRPPPSSLLRAATHQVFTRKLPLRACRRVDSGVEGSTQLSIFDSGVDSARCRRILRPSTEQTAQHHGRFPPCVVACASGPEPPLALSARLLIDQRSCRMPPAVSSLAFPPPPYLAPPASSCSPRYLFPPRTACA